MKKKKTVKLFELRPGPFPDDLVYRTLGIEAEPGEVVFSVPAQKHANKGHPGDASYIIPHLSQVITDPMYLGDDLSNSGKIEMVRRLPNPLTKFALVAVTLEEGQGGVYNVCSSYLIPSLRLTANEPRAS